MKAYEQKMNQIALDVIAKDITEWAMNKGFWQESGVSTLTAEDRHWLLLLVKSQKLMLVVSELAETLECLRKPTPGSLPAGDGVYFSNEEEEIADAIIRLLDYAGHYGLRIGAALASKMAKNEGRPFRHGKEF